MPLIRDQAICIRHWDFSETSQTVWLLTREHGLIRGLAKGARREKAGFSGGIELLTRGEVGASLKVGRDLATLTDWNLQEIFPRLSRSLSVFRTAMYFADLVGATLQEQDAHPHLYDALVECLRELDPHPGGCDRPLLRFQWAILREAGLQPSLDRDARTGKRIQIIGTLIFSPEAGGLIADHASVTGGWKVRAETVLAILGIVHANARSNDSMAIEVDGASLCRANRLLAAYLRYTLRHELPTMRSIFGAVLV